MLRPVRGGSDRFIFATKFRQAGIEAQCSMRIDAASSGCEHIHQWPASAIVAVVVLTLAATLLMSCTVPQK